eukprot:TRINITY_DN6426_c0_g1_i1.p2 TRINITY_DN6426_c0_g1~~TRINITY_DN6426_c0_g1_i1.p2  ORF type:complete len:288 (+),score=95.70 TRINITY_DN6426_c0_g1_i1:1997-2860(+)
MTGQAVPNCGSDECTTNPCGAGQGCNDPNLLKNGDFECSCPFGTAHNIGGPVAKCDECEVGNLGSPCAWAGHPEVTETCSDPNPTVDSLNDFVCTCPNGITKVGGAAECETTGECKNSPCGDFQVCSDPDVNKDGDYMCTCSVGEGKMTGGPATCVFDECKAKGQSLSPCPILTQECNDPNTSPGSTQDYVCTCKDGPNGEKMTGSAVDINTPQEKRKKKSRKKKVEATIRITIDMKVAVLRGLCKKLSIDVPSKTLKAGVVELLETRQTEKEAKRDCWEKEGTESV